MSFNQKKIQKLLSKFISYDTIKTEQMFALERTEMSDVHFIVDFENTDCRGLKGVQYLQREDKLDIFFSQCCSKIEMEYWEAIRNAGCEFQICKLEHSGQNALDFYIASHVGELFGQGCSELVAIVSRDKGFSAVRDYWQKPEKGKKIVLKPDIEQCILSSNEPSERRKIIQSRKQIIFLEQEFKRYTEHQRRMQILGETFAGRLEKREVEELAELLEKGQRGRVLYLNVLQRYGRELGLYVYRESRKLLEGGLCR